MRGAFYFVLNRSFRAATVQRFPLSAASYFLVRLSHVFRNIICGGLRTEHTIYIAIREQSNTPKSGGGALIWCLPSSFDR